MLYMLLVAVDLGERLREQPFTGIDAETVASWIAVLGVSNFRQIIGHALIADLARPRVMAENPSTSSNAQRRTVRSSGISESRQIARNVSPSAKRSQSRSASSGEKIEGWPRNGETSYTVICGENELGLQRALQKV
jgi:hypothetical protein